MVKDKTTDLNTKRISKEDKFKKIHAQTHHNQLQENKDKRKKIFQAVREK